jgi:hypothetical protein
MDAAVTAAGQTAGLHSRKADSHDDAEPPEFSSRANRCFGSPAFEFRSSDQVARQLASDHQDQFKADFHREAVQLEEWAAARGWPAPSLPNLQVTVSDQFKISKALVPAWNGRAGHMEFPSWRVASRKAAIAHELVHVFFPNGNRFLAEGLAVYLQAEIGGNPAFPNFGRPLHELVRKLLHEMIPKFSPGHPDSLAQLHLADLDTIATPSPLELKVGEDFYGEEPRGQAHLYPMAGSFVQFLIETRGLEKFRALYERTPLVPFEQTAGARERWLGVYGLSLAELEGEWKSLIVGLDSASVTETMGDRSPGAALDQSLQFNVNEEDGHA